jgi:ParB family chromosome partitioning protein
MDSHEIDTMAQDALIEEDIVMSAKPSNGETVKKEPAKKETAKKETAKKETAKKEPAKKDTKKINKSEYVGKGRTETVYYIALSEIVVPKDSNPRKLFDKEALQSLANSITSVGIIEPLTCVMRDGKPTLIAGERRYRAAKLAELKQVPVLFMDDDPTMVRVIQLVENFQHEHLHPLEEGQAFKLLLGTIAVLPGEPEPVKLNVKGIAKVVGKTSGWVSQRLSLLELPEVIQNACLKNEITFSQARELQAIEEEKEQLKLFNKIHGNPDDIRVSDLKTNIDKTKAKRQMAKAKEAKDAKNAAEGKKKRGRPEKEETTTAPNIARQKLDKALEHLENAKFEVRKIAELREGMGFVYSRCDSAKSEDKKLFYKGAAAALEWMAGFRAEL